jgi:hypothetical protein
LKSAKSTPFSVRKRPAGLSFLIAPAGEMWSVVTESPKMPSGRAPLISDDVARGGSEAVEERRFLDVGGLAVPLIDIAGGGFDLVPLRVLVGEAGVEALGKRPV